MFYWTEESAAFRFDSAEYTRCYEMLAEKAASRFAPSSSVFEGGCGLGHLSLALARRGFSVTAADISPLPLRFLRENAERKNLLLTVREADVFSVPGGELYDHAVFCFFGNTRETLLWIREHCRGEAVLFKKNWDAPRFSPDTGSVRRQGFLKTCEDLHERGIPFEAETFALEMGQPFRSVPDAVRFFRLYSPDSPVREEDVLPRLVKTADPVFPWFFPSAGSVGMITLKAEDIRAF